MRKTTSYSREKAVIRILELCEFLLFCFETDATVSNDSLGPHKGFGFGTWDKVHAGCTQKIGGGWWYESSITECVVSSNLNGIYPRCGNETLAAIHWGKLDSTNAKRSTPESTSFMTGLMKINSNMRGIPLLPVKREKSSFTCYSFSNILIHFSCVLPQNSVPSGKTVPEYVRKLYTALKVYLFRK